MDRFLFRVWDKKEKKMVYDDLGAYCNCNKGMELYDSENVLMQCTGLKDKNGRLIYEGDIFEIRYNRRFKVIWDGSNTRYIGIGLRNYVVSTERTICYVGMVDRNDKSVVEIIGNIHDNHGLLKGEVE